MAVVRDEEYAVVVERERPLLQACAYLLTADEERADRLVQLVLARLYERWDDVRRPRVEALRSLVQTSPHDPLLPWDTGPRIQLIDGGRPTIAAPEIVPDLQRLPADQRAVIVLERYAELPSVQIAEVCGRTVDEVLVLARLARAALGTDHPERAHDAALAEELREAIPLNRRTAYSGAADLDHGRHLVRRGWLRRGLAAAGARLLVRPGWCPGLRDVPNGQGRDYGRDHGLRSGRHQPSGGGALRGDHRADLYPAEVSGRQLLQPDQHRQRHPGHGGSASADGPARDHGDRPEHHQGPAVRHPAR